jgi:hypothetical protein
MPACGQANLRVLAVKMNSIKIFNKKMQGHF